MNRFDPRKAFLLLAAIGLTSVLAIGCGGKPSTADPRAAAADKLAPLVPYQPKPKLTVGEVKSGDTLDVPFILWGGDVATFHANGGLKTQPDSIFAKHGLSLNLTPGDNFDEQVKDYVGGKTPFLRGTMSMLGEASEQLTADPRTQPVVFMQMTWSAGDHLVTRAGPKTLDQLKGKKIALQKGGPHAGMLGDILRTAKLTWHDITVVWTDDVTGDKGPAVLFRKDNTVDACFAVTPDMVALTGGLDDTGTGEKDSVKGARVLVSTAQMKRSIADVYACRKDYYDANRAKVENFAAGYLKACEELVELRKKVGPENKQEYKPEYKAVLKFARDTYGKEALPTEDDADGLVADAVFVGLPGNISFFTDKGNLSNFEGKQKAALDLAVALGDVDKHHPFLKPNFDYSKIKQLGALTGQAPPQTRFRDDVKILPENTIYSFIISFDPDQAEFSAERYGEDFQRALELGSLFGNAVISVRGHADPSNLVNNFRKEYKTKFNRAFDPIDTKKMAELIEKGGFEHDDDLRKGVKYLLDLSQRRAEKVRGSVVGYADSKAITLDKSQIRFTGVGILEPVVPLATTEAEAASNRRVEFRIIKVSLENPPDIDF